MLLALAARQAVPGGAPDDCDALRVDVLGVSGGRQVRRRGEVLALPDRSRGIGAGALDTGVPLSIAGQILARGEIEGAGVLYPELAVPVERFFEELASRGMRKVVSSSSL